MSFDLKIDKKGGFSLRDWQKGYMAIKRSIRESRKIYEVSASLSA